MNDNRSSSAPVAAPVSECSVQRMVFGKLVVSKEGPVVPGSEHTVTSRTTGLPDAVAALCRPDRLLQVDVNPLRLVEPVLQETGGLIIGPAHLPSHDGKPNIWMLISRLRAYPEQGPSKGGRPATFLTTWAVQNVQQPPYAGGRPADYSKGAAPGWQDVASLLLGNARHLKAELDLAAADPATRFGAAFVTLPLSGRPPRMLSEISWPTWAMLDALKAGKPSHWSRKTFESEATFLDAVSDLYALLQPMLRCLPVVSSGIVFGIERFDITYVCEREPQAGETQSPPPGFASKSTVMIDTLHKKPPKLPIPSRAPSEAAEVGHWGSTRDVLRNCAVGAYNEVLTRCRHTEAPTGSDTSPSQTAVRSGPTSIKNEARWRGLSTLINAGPGRLQDHFYDDIKVVIEVLQRGDPAKAPLESPAFKRGIEAVRQRALANRKNPTGDGEWQAAIAEFKAHSQYDVGCIELLYRAFQGGNALATFLDGGGHEGGLLKLVALFEACETLQSVSWSQAAQFDSVSQTIKPLLRERLPGLGCLLEYELEEVFSPDRKAGVWANRTIKSGDDALYTLLTVSLCAAMMGTGAAPAGKTLQIQNHYAAVLPPRLDDAEVVGFALSGIILRYSISNPFFDVPQERLADVYARLNGNFAKLRREVEAAEQKRAQARRGSSGSLDKLRRIIDRHAGGR